MAVQVAVSMGPRTRKAITLLVDLLLLAGVIGCIYLAISFMGVGGASSDDNSSYSKGKDGSASSTNNVGTKPVSKATYGSTFRGNSPKINIPAKKPAEALTGFYNALKYRECGKAEALRPGYTRCEYVSSAEVYKLDEKYVNIHYAIYYIDVFVIFNDQTNDRFQGFVRVDNPGGGWIIRNKTYKSGIPYQEYLNWLPKQNLAE